MKYKVMLVEDDENSALWTERFLQDCDFDVDCFFLASDAITNLSIKQYDLLLLDLNLPDTNGFEVLKAIKDKITIPIIILSGDTNTKTKIQAFKLGVSDYMVKPYDLEELEVRIWATFGKKPLFNGDDSIFKIQDDSIIFHTKSLILTKTEFNILEILINNKNSTVSRENICRNLSHTISPESLNYHIKNIRKKLDETISNPKYLKTKYGVGYILTY